MLFTTGVGSFIRSQLPDGGYPTDLSQIDGERPAPVLAHDAIYTGGMAAMDLLSEFRHYYVGR